MTKEKAKQMAEVLNAYAEGKPIEVLLDGEWGEVDLNEYSFDERESYRIKKEPKYRPFKNAKECLDEMQEHQPIGWLRWDKIFVQITSITSTSIMFDRDFHYFYELLDEKVTFADGQPCGIKE